jgi:hypothetical protein
MNPNIEIELKFLRLNTGEDIITEVQKLDDNTFRIQNPLKIAYYLNESLGVMTMSLIPWIFVKITDTDSYDMDARNIIVSSNISIAMTQTYYGFLNKFKNTAPTQNESEREDTDDDEEDGDDFDEEEIKETKEMLNEIIKKRYH